MDDTIIKGVLYKQGGTSFILSGNGKKHFENNLIWQGYLTHWLNQKVCARLLPQKDYVSGEPIIIMWPDVPESQEPFVEFYYNERLVKYPVSLFGHNAINIQNHIYNFSHLLNENEILKQEEFFYRPALGEFAPSPHNGKFEIMEDGKAYYDKFGRQFMRTIHVIRILGMDIGKLSHIYDNELETIHQTPVDPKAPAKYKDFNFFNRSCSTIIRDGLIAYGFKDICGILPRDLFVNILYNLHKQKQSMGIELELYTKQQLKVQEAPRSVMTPLFNLKNRSRYQKLKTIGLV